MTSSSVANAAVPRVLDYFISVPGTSEPFCSYSTLAALSNVSRSWRQLILEAMVLKSGDAGDGDGAKVELSPSLTRALFWFPPDGIVERDVKVRVGKEVGDVQLATVWRGW